jgi:hypothetical protein
MTEFVDPRSNPEPPAHPANRLLTARSCAISSNSAWLAVFMIQARVAELQAELHRALDARNLVDAQWIEDQLVENVKRAMQAEPVRDGKGNETGDYVY